MAAGVGTPYCPERFRQSAQLADPTSLYGENGGVLAAEAPRPVRLELTPCANDRETPSRAHREIDTSLARRTNNLGSTHGPRVDSGGLPDSSKGEEDFAARRRKEHAKPVGSPTEFLREGRAHR
jgi:hypothetical protein